MRHIAPFFWSKYSKKIQLRIDTPYCLGSFTAEDAKERELHFAMGSAGVLQEANCIVLYWLVDKEDGVIIDARFQLFGPSALIAAGEAACELVIGKNYDQARRITADFIDSHLRDKGAAVAFPEEAYSCLNQVVDAIDQAATACVGIPLAAQYVAPPVIGHDIEIVDGGYPGFQALTLKQKIAVVEEVIAKEVRPYIELDAGGVEVINIMNDNEVIISYSGACTSCHSSTGATLSYIQQILRAKVHPDLIVTPDL